jgi:hypothetical protein
MYMKEKKKYIRLYYLAMISYLELIYPSLYG